MDGASKRECSSDLTADQYVLTSLDPDTTLAGTLEAREDYPRTADLR